MELEFGSGILLAALGVILIAGPLAKRVCRLFGVPTSVGFIVMGVGLGSALRSLNSASVPLVDETLAVLAQLGVVALLFRVGLRSHTRALLKKLPDASVIWIANVLGALLIGFAVARYGLDWSLETSLVVATAFSATSIAVSMVVWDELGLASSDTGTTLLDVAELDDLSAAVLLAVLLGTLPALSNGDHDLWLRVGTSSIGVLARLVLFVFGCYVFAHFLEAGFTRFNRQLSDTPASLTISILGAGLIIAAIADYLGFSVAIGALFAGLAFSRDPDAVRTDGSFTYFYEFLTPFFFIHIGMQTDLSVLIDSLRIGILLFAAAALSKFAFTMLPALRTMGARAATQLGLSMIPRAEIALVVIYECRALDPRIVPSEVFAAMVFVSLATSIIAPVILRRTLTAGSPSA